MKSEFIPVSKAKGPNPEIAFDYLEKSYKAQHFSNFGPLVGELEERLAIRLGVRFEQVVVFSSATVAIGAALATSQMKKARVPDLSFVATLSAIQQAGLDPIVDDVDEHYWMLSSPETLEPNIANVPVLPFGAVNHELLRSPRPYPQVIDAAASLGGNWDLGGMSENAAIAFSFHATKPLGAGEGGVAVFGSEDWAKEARRWSNFGLNKERKIDKLGINGKMSEFQAAFCLSALDTWKTEEGEWRTANERALDISNRLKIETLLSSQKDNISNYWIARINDEHVDGQVIQTFFANRNIGLRFWWNNSLGEITGQTPGRNSAYFRGSYVGLPMFRDMSDLEFSSIEESVIQWIGR